MEIETNIIIKYIDFINFFEEFHKMICNSSYLEK